MSTLSVDMIEPVGSTLTLGQSGDTVTIPSGGTFTNNGTATGFAGGLFLQVLEDNLTAATNTTSTSYVASGLSVTIVSAATASRFLLTLAGGEAYSGFGGYSLYTTFYVDTGGGAAEVSDTGPYENIRNDNYHGTVRAPHSAMMIHSPATAGSITYTCYYKASATGTAHFNGGSERVVFTVAELSS
jgi:hypothetical protein